MPPLTQTNIPDYSQIFSNSELINVNNIGSKPIGSWLLPSSSTLSSCCPDLPKHQSLFFFPLTPLTSIQHSAAHMPSLPSLPASHLPTCSSRRLPTSHGLQPQSFPLKLYLYCWSIWLSPSWCLLAALLRQEFVFMTPSFRQGTHPLGWKGKELICALGHCNVTNADSRVDAFSTEYLQKVSKTVG